MQQQLFFFKVDIGDPSNLVQLVCKFEKRPKSSLLVLYQICRDLVLNNSVLASPGEYEDDNIICKNNQIDVLKQKIKSHQMELKKSEKVDPWMIQNNILSYLKIKLQAQGWNKMLGLLLKGDLFAKETTDLQACEMEMHMQQDDMLTVSVHHPHIARYRPFSVEKMSSNPFPPPQCYVLPNLGEGFISKVQLTPPISSLFRNADDLKLYWLKSHGYTTILVIITDTISHYAQVRVNDMELTYPACCLWDSKLNEIKSRQTDPSAIVGQLLNDLKSIEIYSHPLLTLQESDVPVAPKVAWVKSSDMLKSAKQTSNNITDLPNVQPLTIKPAPPILPTPTPQATTQTIQITEPTKTTKTVIRETETTSEDTTDKKQTKTVQEAAPRDPTRKRTLGTRRSKQAEIQALPSKSKKGTQKKEASTTSQTKETTDNDTSKVIGNNHDSTINENSVTDMLAFEDALSEITPTPAKKQGDINSPSSVPSVEVGKKQKRNEENKKDLEDKKPKRTRADIDITKLDFSEKHVKERTVAELQAFCRKQGMKVSGTKADLVVRILEKSKV